VRDAEAVQTTAVAKDVTSLDGIERRLDFRTSAECHSRTLAIRWPACSKMPLLDLKDVTDFHSARLKKMSQT